MTKLVNISYKQVLCIMVFSFSAASWADDESRVDETKFAANSGPVWVYKESNLAECMDSEADQSDIADGKKLLENQAIRVLTSERNQTKSNQSKKCGDRGSFIACFSIFSKDKAKALSLGFKENGNCGKPYKTKNN